LDIPLVDWGWFTLLAVIVGEQVIQQTEPHLWIVSPLLILITYIMYLAVAYLYSILYFIYVLKDQMFMMEAHSKGEMYTDPV